MEERLLEAHASGENRVAIGRASDYYGQGGRNSVLGDQVFGRLAQGKRPRWLGDLDQPHTVNYLGDLGRALVTLGFDEADGEIWHLPAAPPLTGRRFCELAGEAMDVEREPVLTSPTMIRIAGLVSPLIRELRETSYQFTAPFVSDEQFEAAFGSVRGHPARRGGTGHGRVVPGRRRLTASPSTRNHNHA